MQRVLVTGGAGYIGSVLRFQLLVKRILISIEEMSVSVRLLRGPWRT